MTIGSKSAVAESAELRRGKLSVLGIVFYVIAAASPLVGMTGALPVAIVVGNGAAVPGAYLAVGIVLLLFSVGYAAMSRRVTNTGAFFAYVGRGLGIGPGVGSAYASLLAYLAIQLAIYGFFGAVLSGQMAALIGLDLPWYVWSLIAWAVVFALSAFSVEVGAKVLGVLLALELAALLLTGLAVILSGGGPAGLDLGASFAPGNIFVGGLAGSAGIALAFAFASFIGFEATAIYGEEARDPKRAVPKATYLAVVAITVIFAITTFGVVSALGASTAVDEAAARSTVDGVPLADSAAVIFSVAEEYVGAWLAETMAWLVISSLFAGLLAFQNSIARYFFSMGRAGVLPRPLGRVNAAGAPLLGSIVTSAVTAIVILIFWVTGRDPVLNMFFWFSGLAVVAIVLVEILVCAAVIKHFRGDREITNPFVTIIAPVLAAVGLALGEYLLMSRFGLLAGTVAEGVDPSAQAWGLNALGYTLILLPFVVFAVGTVVGIVRRRSEDSAAVADLVG
ncbi:APC family permease [Paractinoplanes rishiriensis]|uniref:Amino acid permease n=1 Tax=Paractinoplanes rishiriensis TaxID=1050105 RepID=A0A919JY09_9ACTN|nr:APC family permease [Actinoplanes rishiriensis]GIE93041.1 amino acid permease [Actinoplanes rishiriensis]